MSESAGHPVVHLELHTGNLARACAFYSALLGWTPERIQSRAGCYQALDMSGLSGGVVECDADRSFWLPYVEVTKIDAAIEVAESLGGSVLLTPREGPAGWRSIIATPAGGDLALWQPKASSPLRRRS
jgi:predicted enzyme related to lactoylglutathione lyase